MTRKVLKKRFNESRANQALACILSVAILAAIVVFSLWNEGVIKTL
ncbi:hypothetical protein ACFL08_03965 [Patescibacteria group bacterium]